MTDQTLTQPEGTIVVVPSDGGAGSGDRNPTEEGPEVNDGAGAAPGRRA